ncbi:MAG: DMT family transporter [Spirochaetota bacterium]
MQTDSPNHRLPPDRARVRNLIELNVSAVLFGGTALFAKLIDLPVSAIIFGRSAFAALAILAFMLAARQSLLVTRRRDLAVLTGLGVVLAVHWLAYFQSIQVSTVAVGVIALHTYPIMTVLIEPVVDRSRIHVVDIGLALVVFAGIVVLVPEFSLESETTRGVLWGVGSAVLFTARNLTVRRYVQRYSGATIMFYQTAVSAVVILPLLLSAGTLGRTAGEWPLLLLLGTVFTALTQSLYASSLRNLSAKTVSIIATLIPLYSTIMAFFVLGEVPAVRTITGGLAVIVAVTVETVRASSRRPRRE